MFLIDIVIICFTKYELDKFELNGMNVYMYVMMYFQCL